MSNTSERTVIELVVDRLSQRYPDVPGDRVAGIVNDCYARFDGLPIRDFVPLFVERGALAQLTKMNDQ